MIKMRSKENSANPCANQEDKYRDKIKKNK